MATVTVTFTCGHDSQIADAGPLPAWPSCRVCGETAVARVVAPAPRIRGCATGPHCETQALDPIAIKVGLGVQ